MNFSTFQTLDYKKFVPKDAAKKREEYDQLVNETLERHNVQFVCLAGYMQICSSNLNKTYVHKINFFTLI
jgi:folate-dependent phosphoribosylglycinamide formyltransferase PurN